MKFNHLILLASIGLASCATSPDNQYYTLSPFPHAETGFPDLKPATTESWTLVSVKVPDMLDRPQIVLKSGENGVKPLEYDRWAEPLDSMITRILAEDMASRTASHVSSSRPGTEHLVTVTINELDADSDGRVTLSATWVDQKGDEKILEIFSEQGKADVSDINSVIVSMSLLTGHLADKIFSQP